MLYIPVANCAQVQLVYSVAGVVAVNNLYYEFTEAMNDTSFEAFATEIFNCWTDCYRPKQHTTCTLAMVRVINLETEEGNVFEHIPAANNSGTQAGDLLPYNCALVVSLRTSGRGRSSRGRNYIPGLLEQQQANSQWDPTLTEDLSNAFAAFQDVNSNSYSHSLQVVSRYKDGSPRAEGRMLPVLSWKINHVVCSQRRRLPGRGI